MGFVDKWFQFLRATCDVGQSLSSSPGHPDLLGMSPDETVTAGSSLARDPEFPPAPGGGWVQRTQQEDLCQFWTKGNRKDETVILKCGATFLLWIHFSLIIFTPFHGGIQISYYPESGLVLHVIQADEQHSDGSPSFFPSITELIVIVSASDGALCSPGLCKVETTVYLKYETFDQSVTTLLEQ